MGRTVKMTCEHEFIDAEVVPYEDFINNIEVLQCKHCGISMRRRQLMKKVKQNE